MSASTQSEERIKLFHELNNILKKRGITCPMDKSLSLVTGKWELDIIKLDDLFNRNDEDYDSEKCLYKGEKCSMSGYVKKVYGERAVDIIKLLNA